MTRDQARGSRARKTDKSPSHDRWLVSYADFMTLLFALFVILFASSSKHGSQSFHQVAGSIHDALSSLSVAPPPARPAALATSRIGPSAPAASAPLELAELNKQLQRVLGDSILSKEVVIQKRSDGLVISLRELGFFASGRAHLLPGASEKIKAAARVLMEHRLELRVEGHSDDQPIHNDSFQSNWELSSARAMSVLELLVNDAGFDASKISMAAYGPYHSIATNDTAEGRRMNRRVDLVVIAANPAKDDTR